MSELWVASYVLLWVIVAVLCFAVVGLLRQLGLIQLRLGPEPGALITKEGLDRGAPAPDFSATDVRTGTQLRMSSLRGRHVLLLFMTPTCIACRQLIPSVNDVVRDRSREIAVVAVCHGSDVTCRELAAAYRLHAPLLQDANNSIADLYEVRMTPFGFLIDEEGVVRLRGVVNSWPQLEALLNETGTVVPREWERLPTAGPGGTDPEGRQVTLR